MAIFSSIYSSGRNLADSSWSSLLAVCGPSNQAAGRVKPSTYKSFKSPAMLLGFLLSLERQKDSLVFFCCLFFMCLNDSFVWFFLDI
ncbi:hypothetical protein VCHA38P217_60114 [Vibrio chagasii]|nr:hypothetical protein VCHA34P120_130107 [Vibrio chagasii]CAH6995816.1 hypothetical protein VCHA51O444_120115 [Vibrio chagasii]CAH7378979.1 hypothetical protein VCHA37P191_60096 [Vibrio chagasii]CAH7464148.1 hypothetical protein VCHA38P217_60114 [Vibrio chagasii]